MEQYVNEKTCNVKHDGIVKELDRTERRLNAHSEQIDSMVLEYKWYKLDMEIP